MKKNIIAIVCLLTSVVMTAQVQTPRPSPLSKTSDKVGMTDITIEFSRPGVKGRTIFGDLVPYGKLWRTGANANTKFTSSTEFTVGGKVLPAGTYALFTTPNKDTWEIIFYTDSSNWGTPKKWDDSKVATRFNVKPFEVPFSIETFGMGLGDITVKGANLELIWEQTYIAIPFEVPTDKIVQESIDKTLNGTPKKGDYYLAAAYYLETENDMKQAKKWIDKAVKMYDKEDKDKGGAPFWILRRQALIHAKAGKNKSAIKAAQRSLEGAKKAGNADYIKMNTEFLADMMR